MHNHRERGHFCLMSIDLFQSDGNPNYMITYIFRVRRVFVQYQNARFMFTVYIFIYMIRSIWSTAIQRVSGSGVFKYLPICVLKVIADSIYLHGVYSVYSRRNPVRTKSPYSTQLFVSWGCKPIQLLNRPLLKRVVNFWGQCAVIHNFYAIVSSQWF